MKKCQCNGGLVSRRLPRFLNPPIGIDGVILEDAVIETYCSVCGTVSEVLIPNVDGLIAAAAIRRASHPLKLSGEEVRFLRRALGWLAKDLAAKLQVRPETLSKWENGVEPISPSHEKVLRIAVVTMLKKKAPRVPSSLEEILSMDFKGFRPPDAIVEMEFRLSNPQRRARDQADSQEPPINRAWASR